MKRTEQQWRHFPFPPMKFLLNGYSILVQYIQYILDGHAMPNNASCLLLKRYLKSKTPVSRTNNYVNNIKSFMLQFSSTEWQTDEKVNFDANFFLLFAEIIYSPGFLTIHFTALFPYFMPSGNLSPDEDRMTSKFKIDCHVAKIWPKLSKSSWHFFPTWQKILKRNCS